MGGGGSRQKLAAELKFFDLKKKEHVLLLNSYFSNSFKTNYTCRCVGICVSFIHENNILITK